MSAPRRRPKLVDPVNFLLATRDTGYRGTSQAIAEFIDNALQASARRISVNIAQGSDAELPLEITITDDGAGMDAAALGRALTFGGSTRFNDRRSLGRYGMGLPNGALSRARRVEVYSWQGGDVLWTRLDIDDLAASGHRGLAPVEAPKDVPFSPCTATGTVVRLLRCDRLEYKRPSWFARKLAEELGRVYRCFIDEGLKLSVNGHRLIAVDPLFLQLSARVHGARPFGDELVYRVPTDHGEGEIRVRFAELPIDQWHKLSSEEKRERGITNAPSVSVLRADREIDRGWFFMGGKRRENYDDWWRCEVRFEPALDELFGITHSKQAIVPSEDLLQILVPDMEPIARALNSRARRQFELAKATAPLGAAERQAGRAEESLPALPRRRDLVPDSLKDLVRTADRVSEAGLAPYRIMATELPSTAAFEVVVREGRLLLLLNSRHPLYRDLYGPLATSDSARDQEVAKQVALAVLAAARAEVSTWRRSERTQVQTFRQTWADVLATFMNA
ncbi:MAG TPA: ATP-binding protein [Acidimicrobiales bacterium]|jgi:hypothetical protein|nr:ATP-binding protein [Acidimicrobiales bacterium]